MIDTCNVYGIDAIELGDGLSVCMAASGRGYTNGSGGLKWGDAQGMVETLRKIAFREGVGDVLANGADPAAKHFGHPELATDAEHIGYEARPQQGKYGDGRRSRRKHGNSLPDRRITLADLVAGKVKGRTSPDQITYSERGNLQGSQFFAVAGKVYELAKRAGLGREIPTEWFLQDIRD